MNASPKRSPRSSQSQSQRHQAVGRLAEVFVAQWLVEQNYEILQERWHSRWGELDLVARYLPSPSMLVFVEVKARTDRNWDADGLLSVTPKKREKLWHTAELFLSEYPSLATLPCRFDVALVHYQSKLKHGEPIDSQTPVPLNEVPFSTQPIQMGQAVAIGNYWVTLQNYLTHVFD